MPGHLPTRPLPATGLNLVWSDLQGLRLGTRPRALRQEAQGGVPGGLTAQNLNTAKQAIPGTTVGVAAAATANGSLWKTLTLYNGSRRK